VPVRRWHAELALLPGRGVCRNVLLVSDGARFTEVTADVSASDDAVVLPGLTLPGFANAHSHAFHRALRGVTQAGRGSFWTWRERMYAVAGRLDPDSYYRLARAVYGEMALAGITCVGEFHYLHHSADGRPYADPNAMGRALVAAAAEAGLRITLLDTCYLAGGLSSSGHSELAGPQVRFGDGSGTGWVSRMDALGLDTHGMISPLARAGAAIHSVRAVPRGEITQVAGWAHRHGAPLHAHLSEQVAENSSCLGYYGVTPARLLCEEGALGPRTSVVHATHLTGEDLLLLGGSQSYACLCPTTERDLGDGLAPGADLAAAGCRLTLGSDSHAVIDMLEEARGVEYCDRLARQSRGVFAASALLAAATADGHASLGWPDAGDLVPGAWADLVTVSLDSVRMAGAAAGSAGFAGSAVFAGSAEFAAEAAVFAATAADVRHVVSGGRDIVRDGQHLLIPDLARELSASIAAVR
jgi:formiminoglutamate deiminase